MAKCGFCAKRKGKRTCPALGAICSECCGRHRGKDVACPAGCEFLPDPHVALKDALQRLQREVLDDAMAIDDARGTGDALSQLLGPKRKVFDWEHEAVMLWLAHGFVDLRGERAVDRVRRRHEARGPTAAEAEVLHALSEARGSLFLVEEVRRDEGLRLRDLASGAETFVHERLGTLQMLPGTVLLTWVMRLGERHELVGAGAMVPPAHLEAVRAAFDSALARARADAPGEGEVRHASQAMAAAHRALHDAVRDWTPRGRDASGDELTPCDATYEVHDLAEVEALLAGHADLVATGPGRFAWLGEALPGTEGALERTGRDHAMLGGAADDGGPSVFVMVRADPRGGPPRRVLGDVELRTVRLTLACMTRPQLVAGRALLEGLLGGRLRFRHQRFEAVGDLLARGERERARAAEVEAKALRAVDPRDATPLDVQVQRWLDAHPEALAALEEGAARRAAALTVGDEDAVPAPRSSASPGEHHLRPLPHERMRLAQPAAIELAERLARAERQRPGWEGRSITARSLAGREEFDELLLARGRGLVAQGWTPEDAAQDAHTLASHVHYAANYFLHHRKTFWVDDALAWALHRTTLDVPGACLRLPFPAAAFVFADRTTLDLAESLLAGDAPGGARTSPVEMLTVYVLRDEETPAGVAVRLALLFDRRDEELRPDPAERWPYLLGRDLLVRPDDRLDAILDSRHDDLPAGGPDPVFLAPEMTRLVHLVLNAVLYSTSRLLTPPAVVGPPRAATSRGEARPRGGGPGKRSNKAYSDEDVFHLPGTIDISSLERFKALEACSSGRQVLRRFMVRGHWRRAAGTWSDQRLRWIEPYWKGPDMGMIIERDYRLRP